MRESLDIWYQRELDFFRSSCNEFAEKFPKIAARLSLGTSGVADPHVERLIQAFAFLNARTRLKLEDSFPEIVDGMLGILYPHALKPIPSAGIVGMTLDRGQKDAHGGHTVPQGTALETERIEGTACRFKTVYPLTLFPMSMESAALLARPFPVPRTPNSNSAASVLRIRLATYDSKHSFAGYKLNSIRFFLNLANFERAGKLLEALFSQTLEVIITGSDSRTAAAVLPARVIKPVGFQQDDLLLPRHPGAFPGYQLFSEYFVLPQKFLFFDVTGLTPEILQRVGNILEISILLTEHLSDVAELVDSRSVQTGCTPVINLFKKTSDAVVLNQKTSEYRVIPDARAEGTLEIYSVDEVTVAEEGKEKQKFVPLYSIKHGGSQDIGGYWHAIRRPGPTEGDAAAFRSATEMYLTLMDPSFSPRNSRQGTLFTEVTCFNRNLPELLAHRRESVTVQFGFAGPAGPVSEVSCKVAPTPVLRSHIGRSHLWPLVSQLALSHLSLTGSDGADALREILRLNDPKDTMQTKNLINGIKEISASPCVQRLETVFVRGTEIRVTLEDENFAGDSGYLFASVLNQFLSMYTSINSFTRLLVNTTRRKSKGLNPWAWSAKVGSQDRI